MSSIVKEVIKTISSLFIYLLFFTKRFCACKNANQAKTNQQNKSKQTKTTKDNYNISRRKTSKRVKIVCFAFLKKNGNCLDNLIYYTAELCSLNFVLIRLLLPIISQDSSTHFSGTSVKMKKIHLIKIIIRSSLLHYLFLCLCASTFLRFVENSPRRGNCMCYGLLRISTSHQE